jgi:hypothetical protein
MAAEATIAIRALDLTRRVFVGIQQSLEKLKGQVSNATVAIGAFFTFRMAKKGVTEFANALRDVEKDAEKFGATAEELDKVTRATGALDSLMKALKMGAVNAVNQILDLKDALTGVSKVESASIADQIRADRDAPKIKELTNDLAEMRRELAGVGDTPSRQFGRLAEEIQRVNAAARDPAISQAVDKLNREKQVLGLSTDQRKIALKVYEDYVKSVEATTEATQEFYQKQMTAEEQQIALGSQVQRLVKEIEALNSTLGPDFIPELATEEELARMEKLISLQEQYRNVLAKREILETTMQKIARQSGETIAQSLEDAIFMGGKLSEVLKALAQDLLRLAFREAVTAPLGAGLGGFFKDLFRANGGPVGAGNPYIVGERGPELFVPRNSGSIISNERLSGASMGGGGVNITYNIAAGVSRAELAPILEMERRRLKAEIPDMVRRGGAYRTAFA